MARSAGALNGGGVAVGAALILLTLGTLGVVLWRAGGASLGPADWAAISFTVVQAAVSALVSVGLAVPVARALARRRFAGRGLLVSLMGAPFLLPAVVAVLALLQVFGRSGIVNRTLEAAGLPPVSIYGFHGVVLAHVFFNLPLAVRMILAAWQAIPAERFTLAASLGFSARDIFRHIERPMLRETVPGVLLAIFLVCTTSFAVALTLGGGPAATTVELAIYQAVRFEFDLDRAAALAGVQVVICAIAVLAASRLVRLSGFGAGVDRVAARWDVAGKGHRLIDEAAIAGAAAFLLVPLAFIVLGGLGGLSRLPDAVWPAAMRSVAVALGSTALCLAATLLLAIAIVRQGAPRWLETAGMLPLASSSLVLGTGLFLVIHPLASPEALALPVTALVNAALALPFALRLVLPALIRIEAAHGRLADALGLTGMARLRWLVLPRLRPVLGFAGGLVAALAMGDLGVVALFAGEQGVTLPLLVQRLIGAYRMEAASGVSLVLVTLTFALFWLFDRAGRHADR